MSTQNIGFHEDLTKIIFQLSSNTHLISSSVLNTEMRAGRCVLGHMLFGKDLGVSLLDHVR